MQSIGELGNIFDPLFLDNAGAKQTGGSPSSEFVAGGGRTLRIGQSEFSYAAPNTLDVPGKRASDLLDLFTVNTTTNTLGYPIMAGRININTASEQVINSLFQSIEIKSDEGTYDLNDATKPPPKFNRLATRSGKTIAQNIIAERQSTVATAGPMRNIADLNRIMPYLAPADTYQPKLGAGTAASEPLVMDRAREELFSKMVNLVTTQSLTYRVYFIGQHLAKNGSVAATSRGEAIVEMVPTGPASQLVYKPKIIYQRFQ